MSPPRRRAAGVALAVAAGAFAVAGLVRAFGDRGAADAVAALAPDALGLPPAFAARLDSAGLDATPLDRRGDAFAIATAQSDAGAVLVQWIDLRGARLRQVVGAADTAGAPRGHFHPTAASPAFALVPQSAVTADTSLWGAMNGAFFETPNRSPSALAFPLAAGGSVRTGGSSPYGPGRPRAERANWGAPLRALALGDSAVRVAEYDPATGAPLGSPGAADAVVSYAPEAHPTRARARFHVLGPVAADALGRGSAVVVVTSLGPARIGAVGGVAAALGVRPETQVAVDGGASVWVWSRRAGPLARPSGDQPLPHYLTVGPR